MARGILVYTSADAEYNEWFINHIIEEGKKQGLDISLIISDREEVPDKDIDFAIVRNRDSMLCKHLEDNNIRCFNSSYVVNIGNDKWEMYKDFCSAGIPVMYTQRTKLPYPFVMKPVNGHGGENVYLIKSADEYESVLSAMHDERVIGAIHDKSVSSTIHNEGEDGLIHGDRTGGAILNEKHGEFIFQVLATEKGRDIRVYVVGGIILTAMERIALDSENDFRSNYSLNGNAKEHAITDEELKLAAKVADHIKADFVGIDLIYNNGKPVVNEIEDAVGTRMLYSLTDIDPVREFVSHIAKHI